MNIKNMSIKWGSSNNNHSYDTGNKTIEISDSAIQNQEDLWKIQHWVFAIEHKEQQKIQDTEVAILKEKLVSENQNSFTIENLKTLLQEKKYDNIKEYVTQNNELRASFHEGAHVIIGKLWSSKSIKIDSVSIWKENKWPTNTIWIQQKIWEESEARVTWWSFFQFTDQHFINTSLAWYVLERWLWFDHNIAAWHAKQDFFDIYNRPWFAEIYEHWREPVWFNESWDMTCKKVSPPLTWEQIQSKLLSLSYGQIWTISNIVSQNRHLLYTLGISLFERKKLENQDIDNIIQSDS